MTADQCRFAPAAARNREPILAVLREHLPKRGLILEVASGTGEHVVHFAASMPGLTFQPSDPDPEARASIDAWVRAMGLANVRPAIALDASAETWPVENASAIICINMIHIAPWQAAIGLVRGASAVVAPGGLLIHYGPFREGGRHTAPSNEAFDRDLRMRNPEWGVRDIDEVAALAKAGGFNAPALVRMPANNLMLLFRKL